MANIIGDIAGRYDELMLLIKKMPEDEYILVGDMIDRGPKSKEVVYWAAKNARCILGNHEHMMIDSYRKTSIYDYRLWEDVNGGQATVDSFCNEGFVDFIPESIISWMESLPLYIVVDDNVLVSHSFAHYYLELKEACNITNENGRVSHTSIIWNRSRPGRRQDYELQIAGHNSQMGLTTFADAHGTYAICLDDSRYKKVTGLHYPSMEVYQQDYL